MELKVRKLYEDAKIPSYANPGDAGMDLYSHEDVLIPRGERKTIGTGFSAEFPEGHVALFWDKSGLASKNGLTVLAGVIDSSYRGEYKVVLLNTSNEDYYVHKGDKIAQMLIQPVVHCKIEEVVELSETQRSSGGFGSSGR